VCSFTADLHLIKQPRRIFLFYLTWWHAERALLCIHIFLCIISYKCTTLLKRHSFEWQDFFKYNVVDKICNINIFLWQCAVRFGCFVKFSQIKKRTLLKIAINFPDPLTRFEIVFMPDPTSRSGYRILHKKMGAK
jgi:hypothetical protein